MAVELAAAYVTLIPSARGVTGAISRELSGPTSKVAATAGAQASSSFAGSFSKGLGRSQSLFSRFGSAIRRNLLPIGIGLAALAAGAVSMGLSFVHAAEDSIKVSKQTAAVLTSTGGAARVSAGHVADLASQLSRKTAIDDELIQSGENVLLTFTSIRNEVGRGNDIFDQATGVALDMSVALGQDLQSSVIQVGKALQDPIRGITALRRVGVNFSEDQVATIRRLVETGDALGAQKLILKELTTEFGGSAAAQATASDKLSVAWENLKEELGARLLPKVEEFSDWLIDKGIPKVLELADWIETELLPRLGDIGTWVRDNVLPPLGEMWSAFHDDVLPILTDVGNWVDEHMAPAFERLAGALGDTNREAKKGESAWGWLIASALVLGGAAAVLGTIASVLGNVAAGFGILGAVISAVLSPLGLFLAGIAFIFFIAPRLVETWQRITDNIKEAVGGALVAVMDFMDRLRDAIVGGLGSAATATMGFMDRFRSNIIGALASVTVLGQIVRHWDTIRGVITGVAGAILGFLGRNWPTILAIMGGPVGLVVLAIVSHWTKIRGFITGTVSAVLGFVGANWPTILALMAGPSGLAMLAIVSHWGTIRSTVTGGVTAVLGFVGRNWPLILGLLGGPVGLAVLAVTQHWNTIRNIFRAGVAAVIGFLGRLPGRILGLFADAGTWLVSAGGEVIDGLLEGIRGALPDLKDWFVGLPNRVLGWLGFSSPPGWAITAGKLVIEGLIRGLSGRAGQVSDFLMKLIGSVVGKVGGGAGVARWKNVALSALAYTGQSATWINDLLTQMAHESGGNPRAINLTDINARQGHPSQGLMQTIPSTFMAYARELAGRGILDPFANIVAAIRYTLARYGTLGAWRARGFKGYETGAWRVPAGGGWTHPGEMVLPARLADAVRATLSGGTGEGWPLIGILNLYATTVEEGRAAAKGFMEVLDRRHVRTEARIA